MWTLELRRCCRPFHLCTEPHTHIFFSHFHSSHTFIILKAPNLLNVHLKPS